MKLTQKQEKFCLYYFEYGNASEAAIAASYRPRYAATNTTKLLNNTNIKQRLAELNEETKTAKIMDVVERKERLSEIARARLTDYVTCGPDRDLVDVGPDSPNTAALSEITARTEFDKDGAGAAVITKVRLHNPMQAIAELNKMERIYEEGTTVNIDNRKAEIIVTSENARKLLTEIADGVEPHKESIEDKDNPNLR